MVEEQVPNAFGDGAPTRLAAEHGAYRASKKGGLGGLADAFTAFDRDQPAGVCTVRRLERHVGQHGCACRRLTILDLVTSSVIASSCEAGS